MLFGALTLILGIVPSPLFDVVRDVGAALGLRSRLQLAFAPSLTVLARRSAGGLHL